MNEDATPERDSIEELKKRLYRRGATPDPRMRSGFSSPFSREGVPELTEQGIQEEVMATKRQSRFSFVHKLFFGSVLFFLIAAGVSAYFFLSGSNVFSPENIDIVVSGPVATEGGKELSLQVTIVNKNSTALENVDFVVEYPEGTRDADDTSKDLIRPRQFLGVIGPGQVINKTVRAVLFGEENSQKSIKLRLEYERAGSPVGFTKEKNYILALTSAPVGITVTLPRDIISNDEVPLSITVGSNSNALVKDILVSVAYPPGFSFKTADPVPAFGTSVWRIGDLAPGQKREIQIKGILEGQNDEVKAFKVSAGTSKDNASEVIGTVYTTAFKTLAIQRPRIGADLSLNGSTDEVYVAPPVTAPLKGEISFRNNLPDRILDAEVSLRFIGALLDRDSVSVDQGGFYQSSDNSITWDKSLFSELETLEPGSTGKLNFLFGPIPPLREDYPKGRNPEIGIEITIHGTRLAPGRQAEKVEAVVKRRVKLSSALQLASRAVYSSGPFKNTGPLPPKVDQKTTYTIIWSATNPSSDVTGATVEANLPGYMEWIGVTSPSNEKISFNDGKIVWTVGDLRAGTGLTSSAREVAFQVGFKASLAQAGVAPVILSDAVLKGTDQFTKTEVRSLQRGLTTFLSTDPTFKDGEDRVVR